jgi:hypothetical protein
MPGKVGPREGTIWNNMGVKGTSGCRGAIGSGKAEEQIMLIEEQFPCPHSGGKITKPEPKTMN